MASHPRFLPPGAASSLRLRRPLVTSTLRSAAAPLALAQSQPQSRRRGGASLTARTSQVGGWGAAGSRSLASGCCGCCCSPLLNHCRWSIPWSARRDTTRPANEREPPGAAAAGGEGRAAMQRRILPSSSPSFVRWLRHRPIQRFAVTERRGVARRGRADQVAFFFVFFLLCSLPTPPPLQCRSFEDSANILRDVTMCRGMIRPHSNSTTAMVAVPTVALLIPLSLSIHPIPRPPPPPPPALV